MTFAKSRRVISSILNELQIPALTYKRHWLHRHCHGYARTTENPGPRAADDRTDESHHYVNSCFVSTADFVREESGQKQTVSSLCKSDALCLFARPRAETQVQNKTGHFNKSRITSSAHRFVSERLPTFGEKGQTGMHLMVMTGNVVSNRVSVGKLESNKQQTTQHYLHCG